MTRTNRQHLIVGFTFIAPNFIAFLIFVAGPVVAGLVLSFTEWDLLSSPQWVGISNYVTLLTRDNLFWTSLWNTVYYALLTVPVGIVVSLGLALLMNLGLRGTRIYRTLFFIPVVASTIAVCRMCRSRCMRPPPSMAPIVGSASGQLRCRY